LKKNKNIYAFRVDASLLIGTGQLMRSLTLADALKKVAHIAFYMSFTQITFN